MKLRTSYEQCYGNEECSLAHYCWYASASDVALNKTQCLPLYSQDHLTEFGWVSKDPTKPTFEDYKQNGLYCRSGLAFPYKNGTGNIAKCTTTDHIKFSKRKIASPYQCDPTNNEDFCQLNFNITPASIAIPAT